MSRSEARERFTAADLRRQTVGVECRKDRPIVDEIPGACKPIDRVMQLQRDMVEVVHTLKQVVCVKGGCGSGGSPKSGLKGGGVLYLWHTEILWRIDGRSL